MINNSATVLNVARVQQRLNGLGFPETNGAGLVVDGEGAVVIFGDGFFLPYYGGIGVGYKF